jgi:glycosyltransferase involved in cell wall biosynthesis
MTAKRTMKRILISSELFPPDYSGAGLRAYRMALRLGEKYGLKFNALCLGKPDPDQQGRQAEQVPTERMGLIRDEGFAFPLFLLQGFCKATHYLSKTRKDIDVIHMFSFSWMNRMVMLSNILLFRKKTILEIILDHNDDLTTLLTEGKRNRLLRPFTRFLLKRIDRFIVLSDYGLSTCLAEGIPREKIWFRPNPVDDKIFGNIPFQTKSALKKKLHIKSKFTLMTVGLQIPRKNQLFLLKAMDALKAEDISLLIIGPAHESFPDYPGVLKKYIADNHLSGKVSMLGERKNINEYLIASDLFVFASENEGSPNVIQESLVSGLPVIMIELKGNGINKYIHPFNGVIVPKGDDERQTLKGFIAAVRDAHRKKTDYDRKRIRDEAMKKFSAKKIDREYAELYESLVA